MERFKPWKELVLALRSIADAIEGKGSGSDEQIDNKIYAAYVGERALINKNMDISKFKYNPFVPNIFVPTKLEDVLTQEGVDIINSILDFSKNSGDSWSYNIGVFGEEDNENILVSNILTLYKNPDSEKCYLTINDIHYYFETTDKFALDTVAKKESQQ